MLFNSINFILFFASYYFYMCWNAKYALLLACSTVITFLSGIVMEIADGNYTDVDKNRKVKKLIMAASFIINLGILALFKYGSFVLENVSLLTKQTVHMPDSIILPVGISFYTFQALSYTVDVYRRDIKAEKNIVYYALFVSFFRSLLQDQLSVVAAC